MNIDDALDWAENRHHLSYSHDAVPVLAAEVRRLREEWQSSIDRGNHYVETALNLQKRAEAAEAKVDQLRDDLNDFQLSFEKQVEFSRHLIERSEAAEKELYSYKVITTDINSVVMLRRCEQLQAEVEQLREEIVDRQDTEQSLTEWIVKEGQRAEIAEERVKQLEEDIEFEISKDQIKVDLEFEVKQLREELLKLHEMFPQWKRTR